MIRPLTRGECLEQLGQVRERYLQAEQDLQFAAAFGFWTDLQRLLDQFIHMPLPRVSPENGDGPCTDSPSPGSAPSPS
jgi:hypothetical protein